MTPARGAAEEVELFAASGDDLGECILWDADRQSLVWIDVLAGRISSSGLDGAVSVLRTEGPRIAALGLREGGGYVAAHEQTFSMLDAAAGVLREWNPLPDMPASSLFNDGRVDRAGRFVCGGMDRETPRSPVAQVVQLRADPAQETDQRARRLFGGITMSNSICFGLDGSELFHTDMPTGQIWRFDYDSDAGVAHSPALFADLSHLPGSPDGSAIDAEGYLWNAMFGGGSVVRINPDGAIDRVLELPVSHPTCCTLGGPELRTLFITTARLTLTAAQRADQPWAGHVLQVPVGTPGLPECKYGA